jgi:drug/metabolite transporter (DMT)-like permease
MSGPSPSFWDRSIVYLVIASRYALAVLAALILDTLTEVTKKILRAIAEGRVYEASDVFWMVVIPIVFIGGVFWLLWFFDQFFSPWQRRCLILVALMVAGYWHPFEPKAEATSNSPVLHQR